MRLLLFFALCTAGGIMHPFVPHESQKYHLYFLATYNQLANNVAQAKGYYDILFKNHNSDYAYPGFVMHLAQTQQFDAIIALIPTLDKLYKNDIQIQMIIASAYDARGNQQEVARRLAMLNNLYPENPEITFYTASSHAEHGRYQQALACIDNYLTNATHASKAFLFYFLKAQIHMRGNNYEQAKINVKKCLELSPEFDQAWLLLGLINELAGNLDEALANYQTMQKLVGPNPLLEKQIMQLHLKKQYGNTQEITTSYFAQALKAYNNHDYQKAIQILTNHRGYEAHTPSCLLMVELLCKINDVPRAIALLNQKLITDPSNDTWYRALHLLHKAGVPSHIVLESYSQAEQRNAHELALLYKADIYLRNNDTAHALTYLQKAAGVIKDPMVRVKVLYQMALIYYQQQAWAPLLSTLLEGKKLQHDFTPLLNLLAYYYATKGHDLQQAEEIIQSVLKKDKNPHYLDTYALILYKQHKFDQAQAVLTSLIKKLPQDSVMHYHLAKIFFKKGNLKEAQNMLQHAMKFCSGQSESAKYQNCLERWKQSLSK